MNIRSTENVSLRRSGESGISLPIVAGILFSFLTVLGISVDVGNLYRSKMRLQSAVDGSAISGIYLFGEQSQEQIIEAARKVAMSNIGTGWSGATPQFDIQVDSGSIKVSGTVDVPLLILRVVPGFSQSKTVEASANAVTARSIISLVMDTSGSMNCPALGPCENSCEDTDSCSRPTKLDKLKEAAISFVNSLNQNVDQLALIGFNTEAHVFKAMNTPFNKTDLINNVIPSITANLKTHIQSGLREANNQLDLANISVKSKKAIILISDGAPNRSFNEVIPNCSINIDGNNAKKLHYIRAVQEADLARNEHTAAIYTIGVGVPDPRRTTSYQNLSDVYDNNLKPFLLKRIANAPSAASNPKPPNDFECVPTFTSYNSTAFRPKGEYLETADANHLEALLLTIGKSIKALLVS